MPKVVFITTLAPETASLLSQCAPAGYEVELQPYGLPDETKTSLVQDADFLILFPGQIGEGVLRSARRLKLIQLVSAGFDQMDLDLCRELGIPVANNGGTNSIDVAEHTLALMLGVYRRLPELDRNVRSARWGEVDTGFLTYTLHGKTIGIVGLGNIGRRVARLLIPFGARLVYSDPFPPTPELEQELGVTRMTLDDLLRTADIVTLHVALSKATRGFIGRRELALMKPAAVLVNTCRGPVVDEEALIETLRERRIRGAGLDVQMKEPPDPDNPLLRLENVVFTPHSAGITRDTWPRRGEFIFQNLQRVWQV